MLNNVKKIREEKEMTQKELALIVDVTETQIRNIEKSRSIPRIDLALKIANALNCKIEELFILEE